MKRLNAALALMALAAPLHAQGFESSRFGFEIYNYDEGDNVSTTFATALADASYMISPVLGVQVGIAGSTQLYASQDFLDEETTYSLALHGFYDVTPEVRFGLLVGADTYNDVDYLAAIEAIYAAGPIRGEVRFGTYESDVEPADLIEVQGAYAITPQLAAKLNYQRVNYEDGFGYFKLASLGATYAVNDVTSVSASYGSTTNDFGGGEVYDGNQITLGVSVAIGSVADPKLYTFNPFF